MDGSQPQTNPPQNNQPMVAPQHSNLIRTDQVQKLPHLNEQQKAQHTQIVRSFWEILNTRDPQSTEYQSAHLKLAQLSQTLMKGMRLYQANRQQQMQQHQAAAGVAQGQPVQRSQSANPQSFGQLLPQIQQKVNSLNFFLPPNISQEQIQSWLPEARLRYGIALQKQELGRVRIAELRQQFSQRQAAGNLSQEEVQDFKNRQLASEKLYREGSDFLNKFKEQQEGFKAQQQQNQQFNRTNVQNVPQAQVHPAQTGEPAAAAAPVTAGSDNRPVNAAPGTMNQAPTPAPHTINSAVNAARNQAGQVAMTPTTSQPGQVPPTAQAPGATPTTTPAPPQQPTQPQASQGTQPQMTYPQPPNMNGSTPTPTTAPQPMNQQQVPPRPLSHQAAMNQAAQTYANTNAPNNVNNAGNMTQPSMTQPAATANQAANNATTQGYIPNRASDNSARNINMAIPKNLNVPPPEPVAMSPARPTLSGGPSHGAMGMMGQPAIQKHPGYVLEGEGQRVLSKKMLDILVRQVTGGGEGEGLTPDAEEFVLQMADDFVDDVITAACRLAKLRPSSTLELRDIQLVLERNYNMRISGFSTDDLRTVKKPQPTQGWTQKMSAVQAAKVTQGKAE